MIDTDRHMIDMIDKKLKQKARGSRISCEVMVDDSLGKEGKAKSADRPERPLGLPCRSWSGSFDEWLSIYSAFVHLCKNRRGRLRVAETADDVSFTTITPTRSCPRLTPTHRHDAVAPTSSSPTTPTVNKLDRPSPAGSLSWSRCAPR